jgi:hypothetical protein
MADPGEVLVYDVDMYELDPAAVTLGKKRENQGRVEVRRAPARRTPRLDDETLGNYLEDRTAEDIVEGAEGSAGVSGNSDR